MTPQSPTSPDPATTRRDEVKQTMEEATRDQPGEFKDESNEHKVVHIGSDKTDEPIKGIDP